MNLRNRSLLILGIVFFALFLVVAVISFNLTLSGFSRIEYTDTNDTVTRVVSALNAESQNLLGTARDWGWWDDTATFAVDRNQDYIDKNANDDSFATINVHLFIVLDRGGNLVYGKFLAPDFSENRSVPQEILTAVRMNHRLVSPAADDTGTAGILVFPEGPMVLTSVPILPSDKSGQVHGTLIMGRYVDYGPLQRIDASTGYDVNLLWAEKDENKARKYSTLLGQMADKPLLVSVDNESRITGYRVIPDLDNNIMIIEVTKERSLNQAGLEFVNTFMVLLLLWGFITAVIVAIVIDRTVLQRINLLVTRVRNLPNEQEDSLPPVLAGEDELAALEQSILALRSGLRMSERELRGFIDEIPDPAALFTPDGTVLVVNSVLAADLNRSPDEMEGQAITSFIPESELKRYAESIQQVLRTKTMVRFERTSPKKTYFVSLYPVLDASGNVARIGLLTFDISERKRLEDALQKVTKKVSLLNTVIFNDIQNKIFVQWGYLAFIRASVTDPGLLDYLEKEKATLMEIQASLDFARQYNGLGLTPPRWQNVAEVMAFAVSHLDLRNKKTEFTLKGLEIYADALLESVFFTLVKNVIGHAKGATLIRAGYIVNGNRVVIFIEDDGMGIPLEDKERIFEKGAGTGGAVGLFLSREILSITGITIRETGIPGKGARFEITVPEGSFRLTEIN